MNTLYIDIGSTNIKWENSGGESDSQLFPASNFAPPLYEIDPQAITDIVQNIIDSQKSLAKIFISVQMHGYILSDGKSLVTPYISWRDKRAQLCRPDIVLKEKSGTAIKDNLPVMGILSMKKRGVLAKFTDFYTLGSYIVKHLTGNNITHITDASASGFYDIYGNKHLYGMDFMLPNAETELKPVGTYRGALVYTPIGDQQASVVSVDTDDSYILNTGTATQICAINKEYCQGEYESRSYFYGKTLCTVTGLIGGAVLSKGVSAVSEVVSNYHSAMRKLPKRHSITVIGGLAVHYKELMTAALSEIGLPYTLDASAGAIAGLKKLNRQLH